MAEQQKRLNTVVSAETLRDVQIVAAELDVFLHQAVDTLLRLGVQTYIEGKNGDE